VSIKAVVAILAGAVMLYGLFTIGMPFLAAIVIAMFLDAPIRAMMRVFRMNRVTSATIVCTLFTLLLFGLAYLIGAGVVSQLVELWTKVPVFLDEFNKVFKDATERTELFYNSLPADVAVQVQTTLANSVATITSTIAGMIKSISSYFLGAAKAVPNLFVAFIVFMVALYLVNYSLPILKTQFLGLFELKSRGKVEEVMGNLRSSIFGFLKAQIILSALTYLVSLLGLLILRVEYPLAIALLIIIVDVLPILGTGSVLVPWAVYVLIKGNMPLAIGLVALFLVITIFRRIAEPKILGDSIGIGALPTLVGLYIGFKLVGVVGLFLGPIVIMIYKEMRKVGLIKFNIKLE
jgi:sporulation integral membrane protein YtvI